MKLYIQIENGQPVNHPALEENLLQAYGKIPNNWMPFTRVARPSYDALPVGAYEVAVCNYVLDLDGLSWKDEWSVRPMTDEEKQNKIDSVLASKPFESWTFVEETCTWVPPISMPDDGNNYYWNETLLSWTKI